MPILSKGDRRKRLGGVPSHVQTWADLMGVELFPSETDPDEVVGKPTAKLSESVKRALISTQGGLWHRLRTENGWADNSDGGLAKLLEWWNKRPNGVAIYAIPCISYNDGPAGPFSLNHAAEYREQKGNYSYEECVDPEHPEREKHLTWTKTHSREYARELRRAKAQRDRKSNKSSAEIEAEHEAAVQEAMKRLQQKEAEAKEKESIEQEAARRLKAADTDVDDGSRRGPGRPRKDA